MAHHPRTPGRPAQARAPRCCRATYLDAVGSFDTAGVVPAANDGASLAEQNDSVVLGTELVDELSEKILFEAIDQPL